MVVRTRQTLGLQDCALEERREPAALAPSGTGTFVPGLLVGWIVCVLIAGWKGPGEPACARDLRDSYRLGSDPAHWNARELRLLPGIGERRALSALRARNRHLGSPNGSDSLPWEAVPGIGPRTASAVRDELKRRGIQQMELSPGRFLGVEGTASGRRSSSGRTPGDFEPRPESVH